MSQGKLSGKEKIELLAAYKQTLLQRSECKSIQGCTRGTNGRTYYDGSTGPWELNDCVHCILSKHTVRILIKDTSCLEQWELELESLASRQDRTMKEEQLLKARIEEKEKFIAQKLRDLMWAAVGPSSPATTMEQYHREAKEILDQVRGELEEKFQQIYPPENEIQRHPSQEDIDALKKQLHGVLAEQKKMKEEQKELIRRVDEASEERQALIKRLGDVSEEVQQLKLVHFYRNEYGDGVNMGIE